MQSQLKAPIVLALLVFLISLWCAIFFIFCSILLFTTHINVLSLFFL